MSELAAALARRRDLASGKVWASEIIDGQLFLGAGRDAQNLEQLRAHGITHVLNVADDVPNYHEGPQPADNGPPIVYKRLEVQDFGADAGISRVFGEALKFVQAARLSAESAGQSAIRAVSSHITDLDATTDAAENMVDMVEGDCAGTTGDEDTGNPAHGPAAPRVLVHCANGSNRSVTVVIALLMLLRKNLTLKEAFEEVRSRRAAANPLKDNRRELARFECRHLKVEVPSIWGPETGVGTRR